MQDNASKHNSIIILFGIKQFFQLDTTLLNCTTLINLQFFIKTYKIVVQPLISLPLYLAFWTEIYTYFIDDHGGPNAMIKH